jgi:hypothetical protein
MTRQATVVRCLCAVTAMLVALTGAACNSAESQRREIEAAATAAAQRAVAEEKAALQREKQRVVQEPSNYLEPRDVQVLDRGIVRHYREMSKFSVLNKAKWPVSDISGEIDWLGDNDVKLATIAFAVRGSIPAGATQTFSKDDGTLISTAVQLAAPRYRIRFTKVTLAEAP